MLHPAEALGPRRLPGTTPPLGLQDGLRVEGFRFRVAFFGEAIARGS